MQDMNWNGKRQSGIYVVVGGKEGREILPLPLSLYMPPGVPTAGVLILRNGNWPLAAKPI